MSRDRFNEFQNAASRRPPTQIHSAGAGYGFGSQMEMGQMPPQAGPPSYGGPPHQMAEDNGASTAFFRKLADTRETIKEINDALSQIDYMHRKHLDAMTDAQSKQSEQQLDNLITQTTRSSNTARSKIKELNELIRKMTPEEAETARTQLQSVKQKFMNTMTEFQNIESKYRNQIRGRLERQYKIVKPNASSAEVDEMLSQDQGAQVFAQSVLQSNPYGQAQEALREVQERHEDIRKIEKTILELHQLFQDMAMMVEAQSETVQAISTQVEQAEQYTEQATKEVGEAIEIRKRTRKKLWFLCFLAIVLLIIIGVIIYTQLPPNLFGSGEDAGTPPPPNPPTGDGPGTGQGAQQPASPNQPPQ